MTIKTSTKNRGEILASIVGIVAAASVVLLVSTRLGFAADAPSPDAAAKAEAEFFEARVRPVLIANCLSCHGPDKQKSGLRIDSREAILKGGETGPAVVPGKPHESLLVDAIEGRGDLKMPPKKTLPPQVVADLKRWIETGAIWPKTAGSAADPRAEAWKRHWAFQKIADPKLPEVKDQAWSRSSVDHFILAKLEEKGLAPSPQADRLTLIRRASFDLIGLPPTPEEVQAFQADPAPTPEAFAKIVDRLLASPRYGERWGRRWLDVARYADTKGYVFLDELDYPWAYTYRDYVIESFNKDLPYDQFLIEQLAADKILRGDDRKSLRALGFLTVGSRFMNNNEDILDDRVDATTRGLMGLTVACARCHDHKFDPIPARDYYALRGVFASCVEPVVPPLYDKPPATPEYTAYEKELAKRERELADFIDQKYAELIDSTIARVGEYLLAALESRGRPDTRDFMIIAEGKELNPKMTRRWRRLLDRTSKGFDPVFAPLHRLAAIPPADFEKQAPGAIEAWAREADPAKRVNPLMIKILSNPYPKTFAESVRRIGAALRGSERIWLDYERRAKLNGVTVQSLPDPAHEHLRLVFHQPNGPLDIPINREGDLDFIADRPSQDKLKKLKEAVQHWRVKGKGAPPRAMTVEDQPNPVEPRVFIRGNPGNLGEPTPRRFLEVLSKPDRKPYREGSGRLELARDIASKDNPLTARVFVNRVWMWHMGNPLVSTPGDFGLRSDPPTHPELLDHLAKTFIDGGWSIKALHRRIMLSSAYQQTSGDRSECRSVDPENALWWRAERRPLDFEAARDAILAVSGGLDGAIGGPSFPDLADSRATRRTMYARIDRLNLPGIFRAFDFPTPDSTNPKRDVTSVPPQALFYMNHPWVMNAAAKTLKRPEIVAVKSLDERVDALYRLCFGRTAEADERALANEYLNRAALDGPEWKRYVQALFMSNEFYFVD